MGCVPPWPTCFAPWPGPDGANVAAVLLTGMGKDGAAELKLLRDAGALTFAQTKKAASCKRHAGRSGAPGRRQVCAAAGTHRRRVEPTCCAQFILNNFRAHAILAILR